MHLRKPFRFAFCTGSFRTSNLPAHLLRFALCALAVLTWLGTARAVLPPERAPLPNFDKRAGAAVQALAERQAAAGQLQSRLPGAEVDFDAQTGSPKWVHSRQGFLTGPGGQGRGVSPAALAGVPVGESHRALKAFLNEHSKLFGHGAEALSGAKVKREFVTPHNGLQTVVWEQELDGIAVFEGLLTAHTTASGELVSVASGFMANPSQAADRGTARRAQLQAQPAIAAAQAVALAAQEVGETLEAEAVTPVEAQAEAGTLRQHFRAPGLNGETEARLVWLPLDESRLRLCWEVILTSRSRGEMFRVLIDAQTGEALVRHGLTNYITEATYRVYTSDSPSPFSPGWSIPNTGQPSVVARTLVTLSAIDTNASPNGWIDDGVNETRGNNVDAHTDRNGDNAPDLPRPQGSPYRVFDFALDLSQSPTTYSSAAVVQLFYWNNFIHDKLYQLGFTEAAGNFQNNNFGRGGRGNDAVQADAQDGSGYNNANFSTPPDGSAGRMQMYLFTGAAPDRDGDLDAEVVLHEYTHGLSNRRVGNGVGISALQSAGMGEGWSDFYALSLLSEAGDDPNGVYASGGYSTYLMSGLTQNYYFGIRRYPYCTDLSKNPLTFKDIDPTQASTHSGVPRSPIVGSTANEVHNMGEVWCVTLWEARANLLGKYGASGNQLMLQLVTDGMNLSPANPTFLQARDAILQADQVDTGGANRALLWAAFAKRGLGASATSPSSSSTYGVKEAYDLPDSLAISPALLSASGPVGGPFTPSSGTFVLTNTGATALNWSLGSTCVWLNVSPLSGTLAPGGAAASVGVSLADGATNLSLGISRATLWFTNQTSGVVQAGTFALSVVGQNLFDDFEPGIDLSQWSSFGGVVGSTVLATNYGGSVSGPNALWFGDGGSRFATTMPLDTSRGGLITFYLRLANGSAWPWEGVDGLPGEGVVLEASTNSGLSWSTLGNYDTTAYYSWTAVSLGIPAVAQSPATLFRWRQLSHSGSDFDHWALDNVNIVAGPMAPAIASQPQSQTAIVGEDVVMSVLAYGSVPMSYQWRLNGNDLSGATTSSLEFTNVGFGDAGTYSVLVSNSVGVLLSSNAVLAVNPPPPCTPVPAGLVSWWRGQGDATDFIGVHNGSLSGGVTFGRGKAGQGFVLDGASASVGLGNWFNLQVFSVALWVKAGVAQLTYADLIDNNHRDSPWRSWTVEYQNTGLRFAWEVFTLNSGYISLPFDLKANTWQYLVLTLDDSRTARVYLDGQLQGSTNLIGAVSYDGTESLWLGRWVGGGRYFNGSLDEVDVYNRALAPAEIQALYASSSTGKCVVDTPPAIVTQPADQTVFVGADVVLNVLASGTQPLSYQWNLNGTNLVEATNASLFFNNVQPAQAGTYTVLVTNRAGSVLSSNALLTVNPPPPCTPAPAGLVSWWRAEGNGSDFMGLNNGTPSANVSYGTGRVGTAFVFGGTDGNSLTLGNAASLQLQNFTIEAWVKRASATQTTKGAYDGANFLAYGNGGYSFAVWADGSLSLGKAYYPGLRSGGGLVVGTNWHHVAVTKSGGTVIVYADGVGHLLSTNYDPGFVFTSSAAIGMLGDGKYAFWGSIDELALYNRSLSAAEIQALYNAWSSGKCVVGVAPSITAQPKSQSAFAGEDVSFSVAAVGTQPLSYQWSFNGTNLNGASSTALLLANVQTSQAGTYTVLVTNSAGFMLSSNAVLVVNPRPPCTPAPAGLVSWWQAEGDSTDFLGLNNGLLTNGAGFAAGRVGQAFSLNGVNQCVVIPDNVALRLKSVTVEGWFNFATLGAVQLLGKTYGSGTDDSYNVWYEPGQLLAYVTTDSGAAMRVAYNWTPTVGTWHHIAFTFDDSAKVQVLYLDGVAVASGAVSGSIVYDSHPVLLGADIESGALSFFFKGLIDEVSLYNRALSAAEVQALYGAAVGGKCAVPTGPTIISQPASQTVSVGDDVSWSVAATGTPPLSYQWQFNSAVLVGATNATLNQTNVQVGQAGTYSVLVSNNVGAVLSSNAVLVVNPVRPCTPVAAGLVAWWRAEGDATDFMGVNDGTPVGNVTYGTAEVGQGFALGGTGSYIQLGNSTNLQLQNLTIEMWLRRASPTVTTADGSTGGDLFGYGDGGYAVGTFNDGGLIFSKVGVSSVVSSSGLVTGTNFHHVAVTKSGSTVVFYVDGVAYPTSAYDPGFTFSGAPIIGGLPGYANSFWGTLDEVSIYNRGLSAAEIQSLYQARTAGKCAVATLPTITSQPASQTVFVGDNVSLSVAAMGTPPLSYQWQFNSAALLGATNASLNLTNVQMGQAGTYSVLVSNGAGTVPSSNAVLTVNPLLSCVLPPAGLVGWWRAETNALDSASGNNGTLVGNVTYGAGEVGQGFALDGNGSYLQLANSTNLQLQNLTIEMWLRRASDSVTTAGGGDGGDLFGYGNGGYALGVFNDGTLIFSKVAVSKVVSSPGLVTGTNFHHVAVTKSGSAVVFYVDGVAYPAPAYNPGFTFSGAPVIGALPGYANSFWGTLDEFSIYKRGLTAAEVQSLYNARSAGKCVPGVAPTISAQPTNQTTLVGGTAAFSVTALGTMPLSYQWLFNGVPLAGQSSNWLSLADVQLTNAGSYSVLVTNIAGSVLSSNAVLVVNPPPCTPAPAGLVSWWRAEGNAWDQSGTNNGSPSANVSYGTGRVGTAFVFGGTDGNGITLGNAASLQLQNFTIEAWIKRASATQTTKGAYDGANFLAYGNGGYSFTVYADGSLAFGKAYYAGLRSGGGLVVGTNWHHVAVTKSGGTVIVYADGVGYLLSTSYDPGFVFASSAAIGMLGDGRYAFWGSIDELAIYNHSLSVAEIQALYAAGSAGKCVVGVAPSITAQPKSQSALAGDDVSFSVAAVGTQPLSYQWSFNGSNLSGASSTALLLTNVQTSQAGTYTVLVTNSAGFMLSSNAILTVAPAPPCTPVATGLVSWWRAEGDGSDFMGFNNGTPSANVSYGTGRVGRAFMLGGTDGNGLTLGNPASLQLQNFTIEAWVKRASATQTTKGAYDGANFLAYGNGGYSFAVYADGSLSLGKAYYPGLRSGGGLVVGTNWHHVAVTKSGGTVIVYADGVGHLLSTNYDPGFVFSSSAAIGMLGDGKYAFWGSLDELAIYNRSLSAAEIQALYNAWGSGKCVDSVAPFIVSQPASQVRAVGSSVTFTVSARGSQPLGYQWRLNNADLPGATTAVLTLTNVQGSQAGTYAVLVSNTAGMLLSSNALLTVTRTNLLGFDGSKEFSPTANPVGPWSYGFSASLGSPMYPFLQYGKTNGADYWMSALGPSIPVIYHNGTSNNIAVRTAVVAPGELALHPGTGGQYCLLRFTAPSNAVYQVTATFWGADTLGTTTDVHVLTNGISIFDGVVNGLGHGTGPTNITLLSLKAGAYLDFAVGSGTSSYNGDTTGVSVQIGVNCPPSAGNLNCSTRQNVPLSLPVEQLLLSASDRDGDLLSLSAVSPTSTNGGNLVLNAGTVTYIPPSDFIGVDRFSYTVSDDWGGSASGSVLVHVWSADLPAGTMLLVVPLKGSYQVHFVGIPGRSYSLQRAPGVNGPWLTIATVVAESSGIGTFSDTNAPSSEAFYRISYP